MQVLILHEFIGYSKAAILEFLELESTRSFLVSIRKPMTEAGKELDKMSLSIEYGLAAYAGHRFAEISNGFGYCVPATNTTTPFRFGLRVKDLEEIADLLYECIEIFFGNRESDEFLIYRHQAHLFYTDAVEGKIEAETWGLISVVYSLQEND